MDQLHKTALSYGQWVTGGRDRVGIGACWPEIPTRQALQSPFWPRIRPVHAVKKQKRLSPMPQPLSSRQRPSSKALLYRTDPVYPLIHDIAVRMEIPVKYIIVFLYYKAMPFRDTAMVTGLSSRDIGGLKTKFLKAIDNVV